MKVPRRLLPAVLLVVAMVRAAPLSAADRSFDDGWRFHRGDAAGAETAGYDDRAWRSVELPHDWSIEDLPPRGDDDLPVLSARDGTWRFTEGDDLKWVDPAFDDRAWSPVELPARWGGERAGFGWYRRHVVVQASDLGRDLQLDLGTVLGVEETFFNGVSLGRDGNGVHLGHDEGFPEQLELYWNSVYQRQRTYPVPRELVRAGDNVISVRLYSPIPGVGGIYDALAPVRRVGPFDPGASAGSVDVGHVVGGTGWYRKSFTLGVEDAGQAVSVHFDGVYMDSDVWINGHALGNHPYGYTPFSYELTPYLRPAGQPNTLAVRVRNYGRNSRWYSGSGIYRHVSLSVDNPVHVAEHGVRVRTLSASPEKAELQVHVAATGLGDRPVSARVELLDAADHVVARRPFELSRAVQAVEQTIQLEKPGLWSPAHPRLYRARVVLDGGAETIVSFGVRTVQVDAEHGLRINGETIKLRGGCIHQDRGPLGSASIARSEERVLELLKARGYNAVRTSHGPPSTEFLDAADRLGMLVLEEAFDGWQIAKTDHDYHRFFDEWWGRDLEAMILRDGRHPSVVMWSIGNEVRDEAEPRAAETARSLADRARALDPTRPVTVAAVHGGDVLDGYFGAVDVAGYNYGLGWYEYDHGRDPERVMLGTESFPADAAVNWAGIADKPYVIGDFVWTAVDYIGESGIGHSSLQGDLDSYLKPWPWHLSNSGDIDICGFRKPQSYFRDVAWGLSPIEMLVHAPVPQGRAEVVSGWGWPDERPHWSWPGQEGRPLTVRVFSRFSRVRLTLNGRELGTQSVGEDGLTATFTVPYAPGELRAVGVAADGRESASVAYVTAGPAVALRLSADRPVLRASRDDLAYVSVEAVDAQGRLVPDSALPVTFSVQGTAELAGVCNSDPVDPSSFRLPERKLYQGRALAVLRPRGPGSVRLEARAPGLKPHSVTVKVGASSATSD